MVEVRWTLQASLDLDSIVEFIAKDSDQYACVFLSDVLQAAERISEFPKSDRIAPMADT